MHVKPTARPLVLRLRGPNDPGLASTHPPPVGMSRSFSPSTTCCTRSASPAPSSCLPWTTCTERGYCYRLRFGSMLAPPLKTERSMDSRSGATDCHHPGQAPAPPSVEPRPHAAPPHLWSGHGPYELLEGVPLLQVGLFKGLVSQLAQPCAVQVGLQRVCWGPGWGLCAQVSVCGATGGGGRRLRGRKRGSVPVKGILQVHRPHTERIACRGALQGERRWRGRLWQRHETLEGLGFGTHLRQAHGSGVGGNEVQGLSALKPSTGILVSKPQPCDLPTTARQTLRLLRHT